jgi:DNA-binding NtrC family response regulator
MIKLAIIDDEQASLSLLQDGLSKSKQFQITTYTNPIIAISAIKPGSADVVLCDIVMPQMDGIEVLEKIKDKDPKTVVIMMTGQSTLDRVLKSHKVGADYYILKPFGSMSEIERKILECIGK